MTLTVWLSSSEFIFRPLTWRFLIAILQKKPVVMLSYSLSSSSLLLRSCFTRAAASPAAGWRSTETVITSRTEASWTAWTLSVWRAAPGSASIIPTSRASSTSSSAESTPSFSAGTHTTITWAPADRSGWWERVPNTSQTNPAKISPSAYCQTIFSQKPLVNFYITHWI